MKVILSKKGFDAQYGGYPSPILPDGTLLSLPIPSDDGITYSQLTINNTNYHDIMVQLNAKINRGNGMENLKNLHECHLDPDLYPNILKRKIGWRGIFGQIGAAHSHLANQGVTNNDLFLFFGYFKQTYQKNGRLQFIKNAPELHLIFGYLFIDYIIQVNHNTPVKNWMKYHPHVSSNERKNISTNTIYIAKETSNWDPNIPGFGYFKYHTDLVLTKNKSQGAKSRSKWNLPEFFKDTYISYHKNAWKDDYFQSVSKGQEFVIHDNTKVVNWAKSLIQNYREL